jgi:hypothetical protein
MSKENKIHLEWAKVYWPQDYEVVDELKKLKEENKKLKSDLAFERTMLDNVRAEYKSLQNVNKKMKEELISRIRQPKNVPYWKWVAELMEEDTLQELRDLGKI